MTFVRERLDQPAAPVLPALSAQKLATTAVGIADAEGLEAITMRRLAADLGVTPMAAYRHVAGKDDVFELMLGLVYGEVDLPGGDGWRETMQKLANCLRALLLRHPWLTRLPGPQAVYELTPNRVILAERSLAVLHGLRLDADMAMTVYRTVSAYAQGATTAEIGLRQLMNEQGWDTGSEVRAALSARMRSLLNTGRYPSFERYIHEASRRDDLDWQFNAGLDYVLDGIAARLDTVDS